MGFFDKMFEVAKTAKSPGSKRRRTNMRQTKGRIGAGDISGRSQGGWFGIQQSPSSARRGKITFAPGFQGFAKKGPSAADKAAVEQAKKSQLDALGRGEGRQGGLQDQYGLLEKLAAMMGQSPVDVPGAIKDVRERRGAWQGGQQGMLRGLMAAKGLVGAGAGAMSGAMASGLGDISKRGFEMQTAGETLARQKSPLLNLQSQLAAAGALQGAIGGRTAAAAPFTMQQSKFYGGVSRPYTA